MHYILTTVSHNPAWAWWKTWLRQPRHFYSRGPINFAAKLDSDLLKHLESRPTVFESISKTIQKYNRFVPSLVGVDFYWVYWV